MNASGKTASRAPLPAASATSSASRSIVASRSNTTGSAWTQATFTGSRTGVVLADATVTLLRVVLESFTVETFEGRIGERFRGAFEGETTELELVEVSRLGSTGLGKREPFSVVFRAPPGTDHPQRIYELGHDELGRFELFLVPLQPDERGSLY